MATTTNFPKISAKKEDLIYNFEHSKDLKKYGVKTESITMTGTVKLHGAHMDVVVNQDNTIRFQSSNIKNLTLEKDVFDFTAFATPLSSQWVSLKTQYLQRFRTENSKVKIRDECPFILAGEWIGPKIQKDDVAIGKLPNRCFVIISVQINGEWLPDLPYADISDEASGIFNISRGGFYTQVLPW